MNQRLRSKPETNLCTPNATPRPATSVTAKAASTSQPQGVPADAKGQRGQSGADQGKDGDPQRAIPEGAAWVGQHREQRAEQGAEKVLLVPDRPEDNQRHQGDVQEQHSSRPVDPRAVELEHLGQPAQDLPTMSRPSSG